MTHSVAGTKKKRRVGYTLDEEQAHAWTHFAGIVFIILAGPLLIWRNNLGMEMNIGLIIYVLSFLGVFLASTLYHYTRNRRFKSRLRRIDHIAIYFFIAGSNTPYLLGLANHSFANFFLAVMWILVGIGTIYKLFEIQMPDWISLLYYLIMGWLGIITILLVANQVEWLTFTLVLTGGILYSIGTYFYHRDFIKWYHTVWHVLVLMAAVTHYAAIYYQLEYS